MVFILRYKKCKNIFLLLVEKTHTIEYGAQWVHGVENNISYQLATSRDLLELDEANILSMPGEFNSKINYLHYLTHYMVQSVIKIDEWK